MPDTTQRPERPCARQIPARNAPILWRLARSLACRTLHGSLFGLLATAPVVGAVCPAPLPMGACDVNVSSGADLPPIPPEPFSATQNTSAIAVAPASGPDPEILCSVYNDGYHLVVEGEGFNGFSSSTDAGASWEDHGALTDASCMPPPGAAHYALGDPSVVWSEAAGRFLIAALEAEGIGLWSSSDCTEVCTFVGNPHVAGTVSRPFLAVDNGTASPLAGRLHLVWTGFDAGTRIFHRQSDDGGATWTTPSSLSSPGADVQAAWPVVAPDGSLLVAWTRWNPFPNGDLGIELVRVEDVSGTPVVTTLTPPMTGRVNPRDAEATSVNCGQPALPGDVLYVPAPQLAMDPSGGLHAVYSYDPDGFDVGDVVDVFYRRSTDGGLTWEPELLLDDGADELNQYFPTVSVGPAGFVSAAWYQSVPTGPGGPWEQSTRRRISFDGGITWEPVETASDEVSPIVFDPELPTCYHGDYDQQLQTANAIVVQWADDRTSDAEVWTETVVEDFRLVPDPVSRALCVPVSGTVDASYDLDFFWFQGFSEDVDLSSPAPAGTSVDFAPDPVPNGQSSGLTVTVTPSASAGTYPIEISAVSTATAATRMASVSLNLSLLPTDEAPDLVPAPGTVLDTLRPELSWGMVALASAYEVEVASDPGFSDVVFTETTSGLSTTLGFDLQPSTVYYWRVRAVNACGAGPFPSVLHDFTTRTVPSVLVVDDDDNSPDVYPFYEPALTELLGVEGVGYDYWDTDNSDDGEPTVEDLRYHQIVLWFTGNEFGGFAGPGAAGEAALSEWLDDEEGCLVLTSQDYHFDRGVTEFMEDYLGVESVANDTEQTEVTGAGTLFGSIGSLTLAYPFDNLSDTITTDGTGVTAFDGDQGVAAIQKLNQPWSTIYLGFPLEALPSSTALKQVLTAAFESRCRGDVIFQDGFENRSCSRWDASIGFIRCIRDP